MNEITQRERPAASKVEINLQQLKSLCCTSCTRMILYSTTESPNAILRNSLDKVTLNSGYIHTYCVAAPTIGGTFRGRFTWWTMERNCSDKFLVQDFEAHNLSFPGNYGFQMIFFFFFWVPFILSSLHIVNYLESTVLNILFLTM